jgi:hypothetical protein
VSGTVADALYHRFRKGQATQYLFRDVDVLSLISSTDVVDLSFLTFQENCETHLAVLLYEDWVSNILP